MFLRSLIHRARNTKTLHLTLRNQLLSMLVLRIVLYTLLLLMSYVFHGSRFAFIFIPPHLLLFLVFVVYIASFFSAFFLLVFQGNLKNFGFGQTLLDCCFVAILIFLSGTANTTFTSVFFFPIVAGGLILPRKGGVLAASMSTLLYGTLLFLETYGFYPYYLTDFIQSPAPSPTVSLNYFAINGLSFFLAALVSALFGMRLQTTESALSASIQKYDQLAILYKRIFENITTGIITINPDGTITSSNNAVQNITGISPKKLINNNLKDVLPCLELSFGNRRLTTDFTKPNGTSVRIGYSFMDIEREKNSSPTNEKNDKIITLQDISEIEKLERQVRQTEKLAAIGMMSASIAHDFRNPLTAISGSAQILANELSTTNHGQANHQLAQIIIRESERLTDTIGDFLLFSRPEHANCEWFSLKSCFQEAVQVLQATPHWPNSAEIYIEFPGTIDIWADRKQMFTVFSHIIQNGLAFCPEGSEQITVEVREISARETSDGNDAVEISIRDNGSGIEPGQEDLIFEPFYTKRTDGTGLGLAIVRQTIEEHRGTISVANTEEGGAVFIISLPIPRQD